MRWDVKPQYADDFLDRIAGFSAACRAEAGCLQFEWTHSADDPQRYVLVETYRDLAAGFAHIRSGHFAEAFRLQHRYAVRFPRVDEIAFARRDKAASGEDDAGRSGDAARSGVNGRSGDDTSC